jgi:hypothetical protein
MALDVKAMSGPTRRRGRRAAWLATVLGVIVVHGIVTRELALNMAEISTDEAMPARMEVAYVREMTLSEPPPMAAPAAPPPSVTAARPKPRPVKPPKPASAPEPKREPDPPVVAAAEPPPLAASEPEVPPVAAAELPASAAEPAASAPVVADAASAVAPAPAPAPPASGALANFEWPASTRISYLLTGYYRGDVNGSAQVEWIRVGSHYQVHLDFIVGPSAAPIIRRSMTSDGEITAEGLVPRRYDQETKVVLQQRRHVTIGFEPGIVVLANGDRKPSVAGVQDTASQFVQLTYVFSTRPDLLRVGGTVDIPLALPHKVDVWTYDVVAEEVLDAPFGPLPTVHLKPRRTADQKVGSLSAEIWFAPQLRYLPVRIRIQQDEATYIDLMVSRPPEIGTP